jgi:predicted glycosyltransferase
MRRTHSIVSRFLQDNAAASVLTLSDSPLGQFFTPTTNHDYLKLPSIVKDGPGQWRATNLNIPFPAISLLRQELICNTLLTYRPQILLVDHMPHGAMGELLPALTILREQRIGTKIVLGLRDILDAPAVVQNRWQVEGAYDAVEEFYDAVLIYGMRDVFDMAQAYHFSPCITQRLHYCGYVCAPAPATAQHATAVTTLRTHFLSAAAATTKLVVAMAGGGADAYPLMRTLLDTLPVVQRTAPVVYVLVTGPFMPDEQRRDLQRRAHALPVHILTSIDDTYRYLQAADLVVTMAGYNTTVEILQTGQRAILVPRRGPSAEQRTRTRLFAQRGWIDTLEPEDLCAADLAALVTKNLALGSTIQGATRPDLNGRQAAGGGGGGGAGAPVTAGHRGPIGQFGAAAPTATFSNEPFAHVQAEEQLYELA